MDAILILNGSFPIAVQIDSIETGLYDHLLQTPEKVVYAYVEGKIYIAYGLLNGVYKTEEVTAENSPYVYKTVTSVVNAHITYCEALFGEVRYTD